MILWCLRLLGVILLLLLHKVALITIHGCRSRKTHFWPRFSYLIVVIRDTLNFLSYIRWSIGILRSMRIILLFMHIFPRARWGWMLGMVLDKLIYWCVPILPKSISLFGQLVTWHFLDIQFILTCSQITAVQLQHHARHRLPTFQLIFVHVIESLVFVPVSVLCVSLNIKCQCG